MENKLTAIEKKFKKGSINKKEYIEIMNGLHSVLWDYMEFIKNKNISDIKITDAAVYFTSKDGIKMIMDKNDMRHVPAEVLNFGDYEKEELDTIKSLLKKDSVVLDIGANIGWYSLILAKALTKGKVIAFEPIPRTYSQLTTNIALNGCKNITAYNFGLSDKAGRMSFFYNTKISGASSLKKLHNNKGIIKVTCKLLPLDGISNKLPAKKIDLVKCDVEGAELFVVRGGLRTISNNKPILFLEMLRKWSAKFNYHPNDIISLLKNLNYSCYYVKNNKFIKIKKVTDSTKPTNFYFLHDIKHKGLIKK